MDIFKKQKDFNKQNCSHQDPDLLALEKSKRIKIEAALKTSRRQFNTLGENSPDIIYTLGLDGSFTYISPAWTKIMGHHAKAVLGKYFTDFAAPNDVETFHKLFKKIRDLKEPVRTTGTLLDVENISHRFDLSGAPNFDDTGNVVSVVGLLKDITEREGLQAQLLHSQKMEAIGTLAGGVAHDFNNLLQAIQGYADLMLLDISQDSQCYAEIQEICHATRQGAELTKQLLTFSRKVGSELRPISINREIEKACKLLRRTLPKMIDIQLELDDNSLIVNADPVQMEQIIMNLGVNARDAMEDKGKIIISTKAVDLNKNFSRNHPGIRHGKHILLSVVDTGSGIDKKTLSHIFEPFFTTKKHGKGTGLGLSIVYGIVKSHGGYIDCESSPAAGTQFKIFLPMLSHDDTKEDKANVEKNKKQYSGSETILLVDDEDCIREIGEQIFTKYGYSTITASNGEQALQLMKHNHEIVNIVILDLNMPGMGGKSCLKEMLRLYPDKKAIITTGYTLDEKSKREVLSQASGFVYKPYAANQLLSAIRNVLDENG